MEIKKIYWIRANIYIELEDTIKDTIYLINEMNNKISIESKENKIIINITNIPEGTMLERGKWYILVGNKPLKLKKEQITELDNYSRIFKYRNNFYACLVNFEINEDKALYINIDYMMKNRKYKKNYRVIEGNNIIDKLSIILKIFILFIIAVIYKFIRLFHFSNKKTILFLSENDKLIKGNLKSIYEYVSIINKYKIKTNLNNKYKKKSLLNYIKELFDIAISDIIIIDNYVSLINILPISKKQKIVQLWHAGVGFKAVGYARFGKSGGPHPIYSSHRKYTHVVVDSKNLIDIYKEVFGVKKEIFISSGMPRLDNYLNKEQIDKAIRKLLENNKLLENKKIILFAPTYRGETAENASYDFSKINIDEIYKYCKENNFVFLIKMHPFIKKQIKIPEKYKDLIFNYSNYDINEIIYISDIMITDYSSCVYEFSFFNRPLIFYRYDKDMYEYSRPMHTLDVFTEEQYEVVNFQDLINALNNLKDIKIENRFKKINKRNNKTCDIIIDKILGD